MPPIHKRKALSSGFRTTVICPEKNSAKKPRPFGPGGAGGPGGNPFELGKSKVIVGKKVGRRNLI